MKEETVYVIYAEISQKQLLDLLLALKYNGDSEMSRRADDALRNYDCMLRKYNGVHTKEVNMAIADLLGRGERQ